MHRAKAIPMFLVAVAVVTMLALTSGTGVAQTLEDLINPPAGEWPTAGRTPENTRFSPLDQINRDNIGQLRLTWSRDLGFGGNVQSSPVVWDGVMYINGVGAVVALDATNGDLLWEYRPELNEAYSYSDSPRMRGGVVVYDGKVFYARGDAIVVALDVETGEEVWSTTVGNAELREGFTAGPIFADGKIVVGLSGADEGGAPGRILALDSQDGEILWTFNVVPLSPDDPGYATWEPNPPSWEAGIGGGSPWNFGTYDPVTGTVIYGTGQPIPWYRSLDSRRNDAGEPSADLYTSSKVALDVDTGELKWYRQIVPGDEWDYDQQTVATVTNMEIDGQTRRVIINPTTTGWLELLDAETGEFIDAHQMHPEVNVHIGYEEDGTPIINDDKRFTRAGEFKRICPGLRWAHWNLGAYSPETGLYYRPNDHICTDLALYTMPNDWEPGQDPNPFTSEKYEEHYFDRYGGLSAIDPITGEVVWEFGVDYPMKGGAFATAGDLVFAAFPDRTLRAFDAETGEILWQQVLTAHMSSQPITYAVDGVQYVATLVGHPTGVSGKPGLPQTVPGDAAAFVFALPEEAR